MTKVNKNSKSSTNQKKINPSVIVIVVIIVAALIALFFPQTPKVTQSNYSTKHEDVIKFKKEGEVTFVSNDNNYKTKIDVELADSFQERTQGLMYREHMAESEGMLFVFPNEEPQSFWMRNTLISLDMIFVNSKFEIVKIHKNTHTLSDTSYPSGKPAQYVIEVIAGFTDKFNIVEGDKIVWRKV